MRTEIEIQNRNAKELIKLMTENLTLRVIPKVDSEIIGDDGYSWWIGKFGRAKLDEIWCNEDRIYIKSEDEDELIDDYIEDLCCDSRYDDVDEDVIVEMAENMVNELDWEEVIIVDIDTP